MLKSNLSNLLRSVAALAVIAALTACEQMPGSREQQGAVIGGAAGAAVGAGVAKEHRGIGAVVGGLLGAGGGYIIAKKTDKGHADDEQAATQAARKAQENPATPEDARKAMTADLNMDGFVTLDEVVAVKQAGYTDAQLLERLRATDQVFELTADQEKYLTERGFSPALVAQVKQINANKAQGVRTGTTTTAPIISEPAPK